MPAKPTRSRTANDLAAIEAATRASGLPAPPPPDLDPFLDAAARCFARHGIRRTSVHDVAGELGVNRATVYRRVGSIERQAALLLARDLNRVLATLPGRLVGRSGPDAVIDLLATVVSSVRHHPVMAKILQDEPDLVGSWLTSGLPALTARVAPAIVPLLRIGMERGDLARRDPAVVAEWVVRIGVSLTVAPPPGDLRAFLAEILVPSLAPQAPRRR